MLRVKGEAAIMQPAYDGQNGQSRPIAQQDSSLGLKELLRSFHDAARSERRGWVALLTIKLLFFVTIAGVTCTQLLLNASVYLSPDNNSHAIYQTVDIANPGQFQLQEFNAAAPGNSVAMIKSMKPFDASLDKATCASAGHIVRLRGLVFCQTTHLGVVSQHPTPNAVRYRLLIEKGLEAQATTFVESVTSILASETGWGRGALRFARVADRADLTVLLALPRSVARLCRPLITRGAFSCGLLGRVVINFQRWRHGSTPWGKDIIGYRHYLINHEVGHVLGLSHASCPELGAPAPIMLPQSRHLDGCNVNGGVTLTDLAMLRRVRPNLMRRSKVANPKHRVVSTIRQRNPQKGTKSSDCCQ